MNSKLREIVFVRCEEPKEDYAHRYGSIIIQWFDCKKKVDVIFERDDNKLPPSDTQMNAFISFIKNEKEFFTELPAKLFKYFENERSVSPLDKEVIAELFPQIRNPMELKNLVGIPYIVVSYFDGQGFLDYIGLGMSCHWEEEHGLGVKIEKNQVTEIGYQDIIL